MSGHGGDTRAWQEVLSLAERLIAPDLPFDACRARQICQLILDQAVRLIDGQAKIWLNIAQLPELTILNSEVDDAKFQDFPAAPTDQLMMQAAYAQAPCYWGLLSEGRPESDCFEGQSLPGYQQVAFPLTSQDPESHERIVLGVLKIEHRDDASFSSEELELFGALAGQAALALQVEHQKAAENWRLAQLTLVHKVSAQIASVRELDELARRLTDLIQRTFQYYYVAIFTLEPGQEYLRFRASAGAQYSRLENGSYPSSQSLALMVRLGEGIIGHAALSGEEVLACDVGDHPLFRYLDSLPETRSETALPLKIEDRVLGVLDVQSDQLDGFNQTDLLVLRALAGNTAVAVEGAQLYSALHQRAEQLKAVSEVSNAITSILDLDELLQEVVNLIHNRFGFPYVHIFDVHRGRRKVFYQAGNDQRGNDLKERGYSVDLDDPQGLIPWVARHGETTLVNNVESDPRYRPSILPPDNTRSELTVPLIFGGETLGVLDVQSDRPNAFREEDRYLFEALADNIAVALRNATLYRSERWRRQVADSMREVAGLLSANVDVEQVLEAILTELDHTLPCDISAIWLAENAGELRPEDHPGLLRLAAVHGPKELLQEIEIGLSLEEVAGSSQAHLDEGERLAGWLKQALAADQTLIREAGDPFELLGALLGFTGDYSAIVTPLRVHDHCVGVLALAHHTAGRYGGEAQAMTAAFASYAAAAIENARLYEAAHEQAWISTVLLQVADATQSISNINELLSTVVQITPRLVGVEACALYLLDESNAFIPAAAFGFSPDQQAEFQRWRFAPSEASAFERMRQAMQPVVLYNSAEEPALAGIINPEPGAGGAPDVLFVLAPLQARGELLGAMLIDYSGALSSKENLESFFDERLAIVQGIAHQTAVAIENLRLIRSQKEEAYVSVALLQVAQAVVSSSDLDETLEAIVRITPILVGVKRAAIFLSDVNTRTFYLAQSYGLPRSEEGRFFAPGQFPLLDAVFQDDRLLAGPFDKDAGSANPLESWAKCLPFSNVDELFQSAGWLLMGFPLSIKGEVLGILLVEEPDLPGLETLPMGNANLRLREKRVEITTGISQQAALAIQNDRLQKKMLERERLEREMQLAREIQFTLLPRDIPDLPGWDLNVWWRTAREVGGDFYDFFELPGNRLGLVIADVADKGMPAALFMTLVRTLVRATAQHVESPGEVMQRVNDALAPDAQQGMFVTLVYAILDLDTGELIHANAGHNPPILYRKQARRLKHLDRGGMALGVMEGTRVSERTLWIEPGDCLVFYTDGITEAFSPEGEMYGDNRLRREIMAAQDHPDGGIVSAQEMIEVIDQSLSEFLGQSPLADDLTLLVIVRLENNPVEN